MRLVVVSHKPCWRTPDGGIATDGGFPMQMRAIAGLVDELVVCVPVSAEPRSVGSNPLTGPNLVVAPLRPLRGDGLQRKLRFPWWALGVVVPLLRELRRADAVHTPIPGDVGTLGILLAELLRKPLFVRHCGNWLAPRTRAEHVWKRYMARTGRGRRVMLATGGATAPPTPSGSVSWIFSTSLDEAQVRTLATERTLPAPSEPVRLLVAGRQVRAKGTGIAIEALALLRGEGNYVLRVLGGGEDLDEFRRLATSLGCDDLVTFDGPVTHDAVLEALRETHVFLLPTSSSEGFPKVVTESLAAGVPVVGTNVSVLPLLLEGCGAVVDPVDAAGVAAAVRDLLAEAGRYEATSRAAVDRARDLTLERWQQQIGAHLEAAWGPLRSPEAPPRVLVAGPLLGGNAGWVVSQGEVLADHLRAEGHAVRATSTHPGRAVRLLDTVATIVRSARTTDVCVVLVFSGPAFAVADVASWTAARFGLPVVFHLHGGNLPEFSARHPRWVRRVLRRGADVVAPSPYLARSLEPLAGPVRIIPNVLPPAPAPAGATGATENEVPRILWMRTFHPIYRPELAVEAFRRVAAQHPTVRLTMAGQEKGSGEAVRALVEELGLVERVDLPGFLGPAAKEAAFASHALYLNTTAIDNAPVSVMEAAAHGLPIVATEVGGLRDLLEDGRSALLTAADPDALAEAVLRLLHDPQLAGDLGREARALSTAWTWPAVAPQWAEVLARAARPGHG